jgi:hypothetical protein
MHLKDPDRRPPRGPRTIDNDNDGSNQGEQEPDIKTIQEALDLLSNLRTEVVEVLRPSQTSNKTKGVANKAEGLRVNLDRMGTLQSDKNETAHVLWIGPETNRSSEKTTLERVAGMYKQGSRLYTKRLYGKRSSMVPSNEKDSSQKADL